MNPTALHRRGALLAINLLFLMVWGFTGFGKLASGPPDWFPGMFGQTILAKFPGLTITFWMLAIGEALAAVLAAVALVRLEFLARRPPVFLTTALVWSLFLFVQLGLGKWLTNEFEGAFQLFLYFCGTLLALQFVAPPTARPAAEA